jgi:hypothetical protein
VIYSGIYLLLVVCDSCIKRGFVSSLSNNPTFLKCEFRFTWINLDDVLICFGDTINSRIVTG